MSAKFGPAGNSDSFTKMGYKHSLQVPEYIEKMGLDAFEYQCGREWVRRPLRDNFFSIAEYKYKALWDVRNNRICKGS